MSDLKTQNWSMPPRMFAKIQQNTKKGPRIPLLPTRSNTPDESSPIDSCRQNFSDHDSNADAQTTASTPHLSHTDSSNSLDYPEPVTFEIDVRPKKKRFNTVQERITFVDEYKKKYKTEMCKNWELRGVCKFGDKCCFAHGKHELKAKALTHVKYKSKPCKQYHQAGYCPYGQRCQYLHKEALVPNIFFQPLEEKWNQNSYTYEMLHEINMLCSTEADITSLLHSLPKRPRLNVFKTLVTANC